MTSNNPVETTQNTDMLILSSAYLPPVQYFAKLLAEGECFLEQHEHFIKQTYRNRCVIDSPNGPLSLTVPVEKTGNRSVMKDIRISDHDNWRRQHWQALVASYYNSPFFEYYQDDIFGVLDSGEKYLFDLNTRLTDVLMENLGIRKTISLSEDYIPSSLVGDGVADFRGAIHPKKVSPIFGEELKQKPYYQVFSQKYGFISGLSVLDLLFNEGPEACRFLKI
jgi:hypothetical protein